MEPHGKNQPQSVIAIIPARYASTRLPGKLLLPLAGKPLILHTLERAKLARNVSRVIVATDDERIFDVVSQAGGEAVMTSAEHRSGSDRIAEVAERLPEGSVIVNVQGDEPMIPVGTIETAVDAILADEAADIVTTCERIEDYRDVLSPDTVKVVTDTSGYALYFSRSPIPFPRVVSEGDGDLENALVNDPALLGLFRKHTGLYVYRREFLLRFAKMEPTLLERTEMLEQLRAIENGARIKVVEVSESSIGVDSEEDYEKVRSLIQAPPIKIRKASENDVPQIAHVHVESWRSSFPGLVPEGYLKGLSKERRERVFAERFEEPGYCLFVAENPEDGVIGFLDFGPSTFEKYDYDRQIYSFYFLKEFQRRGYGRLLFEYCVNEIREQGHKSLCLDSFEMSPYRNFYEKMGGRIVGRGSHRLGDVEYATVIYGWEDLRSI